MWGYPASKLKPSRSSRDTCQLRLTNLLPFAAGKHKGPGIISRRSEELRLAITLFSFHRS